MEVFSPFSLQTAFLYLNNILPQIAPMGACPAVERGTWAAQVEFSPPLPTNQTKRIINDDMEAL
jgi:hypothetical protein